MILLHIIDKFLVIKLLPVMLLNNRYVSGIFYDEKGEKMIIDFHTHIFPETVSAGRENYFHDPGFKLIYDSAKAVIAGPAELIEYMDTMGIALSVAMNFPWENEKICREHNDFIAETALDYMGRILPFAMVPVKSRSVSDEIRKIAAAGFAGIGEIAFYSSMDEESWRFLDEVFENASGFGLPVCIHVNEPLGHNYSGKYSTSFFRLYELIKKYPGVKIVLSHWGGGILFYELMPEVREAFKDVYYDTAASPYLYRDDIYRIASEICGPEKIIFGSDFPLLSSARYMKGIESSVSDAAAAMITGENAAKLLNLSPASSSCPDK